MFSKNHRIVLFVKPLLLAVLIGTGLRFTILSAVFAKIKDILNTFAAFGILVLLLFCLIYIVKLLKEEPIRDSVLYRLSIIAAACYWGFGFYYDCFAFKLYGFDKLLNKHFLVYKVFYLGLIVMISNILIRTVIRIRRKDLATITFVKCSLPYWIIMLVFLIMTYPGIWRGDELSLLMEASYFQTPVWQHFFTSVYYILCLMIIPFPAGVVFIQITVISLIAGYVVSWISLRYQCAEKTCLLYLPFLLLPVIGNNLYPLRLSLYAFIELLYFIYLYSLADAGKRITGCQAVKLGLLSIIIASWRSEGIFFLITSPVIFIILFHRLADYKIKALFMTVTVLLSAGLIRVQDTRSYNLYGNRYRLSAYVEFADDLIKAEMLENPQSEALMKISRTLDINVFNDAASGEGAFWGEGVVDDFSDQDFALFKEGIVMLLKKYPDVYINERLDTFKEASGMEPETANQVLTLDLYNPVSQDERILAFREEFCFTKPIDISLRQATISFLDCRKPDDYNRGNAVYGIFFNLIIPFIGNIIIGLYALIKREMRLLYLAAICFIQFVVVFLVAPGPYFMYYYPVYLCFYVFLMILIIRRLHVRRH